MAFNFSPNEVEIKEFHDLIPEGKHRCRVKAIESKQSKKGNDMIVLTLEISGYTKELKHYIVTDNDKSTDNIGRAVESFGLLEKYQKCKTEITEAMIKKDLKGKVGAINIVHEEYKGFPVPKTGFWIQKARQDKLEAWGKKSKDVSERSSIYSTDPKGKTEIGYSDPDAADPMFDAMPDGDFIADDMPF